MIQQSLGQRKKTKHMMSRESGQATMEAALLLIIIVSLVTSISKFSTSSGFVRDIVEGPWSPIRGMIEDGVWIKHTDSKQHNPNQFSRHQSYEGERV